TRKRRRRSATAMPSRLRSGRLGSLRLVKRAWPATFVPRTRRRPVRLLWKPALQFLEPSLELVDLLFERAALLEGGRRERCLRRLGRFGRRDPHAFAALADAEIADAHLLARARRDCHREGFLGASAKDLDLDRLSVLPVTDGVGELPRRLDRVSVHRGHDIA